MKKGPALFAAQPVPLRTKSIVRGRPLESLMHFTGFVMYKFAQNIFETTNQHLALKEIKPRSFFALHVLINEGPSTQQSLCDGMWIDRATMVGVIDDLESSALVERKSDPSDRRVHRLAVTRKGRQFHRRMLKEFITLDQAHFEVLKEEEIAALRSILERLMTAATSKS